MVTIKDVAAMAGVSIATVSNYVNKTKPVSHVASQKIKKAIQQLNYAPNQSARSLKSNTYREIAVVLPNLNDSYYIQIFQGIEHALLNSDYTISLALTYDTPEIEQQVLKQLLTKQPCGMVIISCQPYGWKYYRDNFTAKNRPIVMLDRPIQDLDANFVTFDHYDLLLKLTGALLDEGQKNLFLFMGPSEFANESDCLRGFMAAHADRQIRTKSPCFLQTALTKEDSFRKVMELLQTQQPETIITTSESLATGVREGLILLGATHISVISLGEEHWNVYTNSNSNFFVARKAIKMGEVAAAQLLLQFDSPFLENEKITLPVEYSQPTVKTSPILVASQPETLLVAMVDVPIMHTFQQLLPNFEMSHNVKVETTMLPHPNMYDTLLHHTPESIVPDVFMYDMPWLPVLASSNILHDISADYNQLPADTFLQGSSKYYSNYNQRQYGIPFLYAPQILYYRKDLFENPDVQSKFKKMYGTSLRPPITLKEFNIISEFFTEHTTVVPYGTSIPAAYPECLAPELYMRLQAYGSKLFAKDGTVLFDNPQTLKAYINFMRAIRAAKPDYRNATDTSVVDDFLKGDTAMLITYPGFLNGVSDLQKISTSGPIGYSIVPGKSPLLGGWGLGIHEKSKKKDLGFAFLKWTCSDDISRYFALLGGQTAVSSTYNNEGLNKYYPWMPLYHTSYDYVSNPYFPTLPNGHTISADRVDKIICKQMYRLISGELDISTAIGQTQEILHNMVTAMETKPK